MGWSLGMKAEGLRVFSSFGVLTASTRTQSSSCMCPESLQYVSDITALWTVARQAPLSMGFSR